MSDSVNSENEEELLKEFEKMLDGILPSGRKKELDKVVEPLLFDPDMNNYPMIPGLEDLEFPDEPPPVPKKDSKGKCVHKKTKKVFYTNTKAYKMCIDCKEDLGDY